MTPPRRLAVTTVAVDAVADPAWPVLAGLLDDDERARASRFAFDRNRQEYVAAHALTRLMLSDASGRPPRSWRFAADPGGKPRVVPAGPCFNLSHCDGLVACAVSTALGMIGVDVEPLARKIPPEVARRSFAPDEWHWVGGLPGPEQAAGFLRVWTLKEAFIKATGRGLAQNLHDFALHFDPLRATFFDPGLGDVRAWRFDQRVVGGHLLALAWHDGAGETSISMRTLTLDTLVAEASAWPRE